MDIALNEMNSFVDLDVLNRRGAMDDRQIQAVYSMLDVFCGFEHLSRKSVDHMSAEVKVLNP